MSELRETYEQRPAAGEHDEYYIPYLKLVTETNIIDALENQISEMGGVLNSVSEEDASKLHAPYTWTIKEAFGHCLDNERVFGYRACRFAAGDQTDLPGYDQDAFVANSDYSGCTLKQLVSEFEVLRQSNLMMLKRLPAAAWDHRGTGDGKAISVRAIAWLLAGHLRHHTNIFAKRLAS